MANDLKNQNTMSDEDEALVSGEEQNLGISADLIRGHINTIILRSNAKAHRW